MNLNAGGIYSITNTITGRRYIGSACCFRRRFSHHRYLLRRNTHDNPWLQNSWNRHGEAVFQFEILEEVTDYEQLHVREQVHVDAFAPLIYNRWLCVRQPNLGGTISEEHKRKLSASKKGKSLSIAHVAALREAWTRRTYVPLSAEKRALKGARIRANRVEITHCKRGHPLTPENVYQQMRGGYPARLCKICQAIRATQYHARQQVLRPHQRMKRTHCAKGHAQTAGNTYIARGRNGAMRRQCRVCTLARQKQYQARKRAQEVISAPVPV